MCGGRARAAEYVPIIKGSKDCKPSCKAGLDPNYKQIWRDSGVRHLGGFNEPDLHDKLPAKRAAELWVQVQEIAEEFDPPLVLFSPQLCVRYFDGNPSPWLTHFLGNCSVIEGCDPDKIKYIGYHYYSNSREEVFTELADRIARFYESFGKKLWITEMAVGFAKQGRQVQDEWMSKTLLALETDDRVFRYTWFATRNPVDRPLRMDALP
ncbi:hypothetical protein EMIHUDRAFT_105277 [Emiliania huxleyi CCMP1516]|uniref:Asl1-like glycosyl hydrolase catalytic domain-containing protein n=2 Tax=Emiliania huxleyi TaxID=2903 RepID=A0A0D3IG13_EMIH1|nr:hypothetical protein EMIHUDRAFT_105277 [Emiliania huxleyi CCMP1516]EOD10198.1 hypothetical protein EMIHUDRAFT_105277 [Emiliania huxleyi CCMP1516]|eukprot:XP_005762627.1 hypothetical protein EMIHUDRAFT_105277 [Emiliania huxleyi CCMP1516]